MGDYFPLCVTGKEQNWKPTRECNEKDLAKGIATPKNKKGMEMTRLASGKGANINHNANPAMQNVSLKNLTGSYPRGELDKDVGPRTTLYTFYPGDHRRKNKIHYPAMMMNEVVSTNIEVKPVVDGLCKVFFPQGNAPSELSEFQYHGSEPFMKVFDINIKQTFNRFVKLRVCRVIDINNHEEFSKKNYWKGRKIWGKTSKEGALVFLRVNDEETMVKSEIIPTSKTNGFRDIKKEKLWYKQGTTDVKKGMLLCAF